MCVQVQLRNVCICPNNVGTFKQGPYKRQCSQVFDVYTCVPVQFILNTESKTLYMLILNERLQLYLLAVLERSSGI